MLTNLNHKKIILLVKNATQKLKQKNIDLIAVNRVGKDLGFNQEKNALTLITRLKKKIELSLKNKFLLAHELLTIIAHEQRD